MGAIGPYTGQLASIGIDSLNAVQMAVDEFNAANPMIEVTVEVGDDGADPTKSAAVVERLVSDPATMGVIGPMTSAGVMAALPLLEKGGLPMITQSATNDTLSQRGYKVFHRTAPYEGAQPIALAGLIAIDLKAKKIYIIDDKSAYGQNLADQVEKTLKETYGYTAEQIVRAQITPEDKDFSAIITKAKAVSPDVFFAAIPSPAQYAALAKQMVLVGYKVQLVGADSVRDQTEFVANAGGATEGAYFTSFGPIMESSAVPATVDFVKRFTAKYQVLSLFSGQSYDTANVMLDAFKRAYEKTDGRITRASVIEALSATKYRGVLGFPIEFWSNGNLKQSGIFVCQVQSGRFVQLKIADY